MRPRFSIRWLMVLIAVSATVCYVLFVRPTVLAHRFVDAIQARDYESAKSLLLEESIWVLGENPPYDRPAVDWVYAEVLPRDWSDIWARRRRLILRVRRHDDEHGRHYEWNEDWDMVSHIRGLQIDASRADVATYSK